MENNSVALVAAGPRKLMANSRFRHPARALSSVSADNICNSACFAERPVEPGPHAASNLPGRSDRDTIHRELARWFEARHSPRNRVSVYSARWFISTLRLEGLPNSRGPRSILRYEPPSARSGRPLDAGNWRNSILLVPKSPINSTGSPSSAHTPTTFPAAPAHQCTLGYTRGLLPSSETRLCRHRATRQHALR